MFISERSGQIARTLSDILVAPLSRHALRPISYAELNKLNERILSKRAKNLLGRCVADTMHSALVDDINGLVYPIRRAVPMFTADAILALSPESHSTADLAFVSQNHRKLAAEFNFWIGMHSANGLPTNRYSTFYFEHFNVEPQYYRGARVLDIGCGPAGSLECLTDAALCVGLDPLGYSYRQLGTTAHRMHYVAGDAERMPFADGSFNILSSMNSLDHVDQLDPVIAEIDRVMAPGGDFLLFTEIHDQATECEPATFSWDIVDRFKEYGFEIRLERQCEKDDWQFSTPFNHNDPTQRYGWLLLRMQKQSDVRPRVPPSAAPPEFDRSWQTVEQIAMLPDFLRQIVGTVAQRSLYKRLDSQTRELTHREDCMIWIDAYVDVHQSHFEPFSNLEQAEEAFNLFFISHGVELQEYLDQIFQAINLTCLQACGADGVETLRAIDRLFYQLFGRPFADGALVQDARMGQDLISSKDPARPAHVIETDIRTKLA